MAAVQIASRLPVFKAGPLPEWPGGIRARMLHDPTAMNSCKALGCVILGEYGGACTVLLNNVVRCQYAHQDMCCNVGGWGGGWRLTDVGLNEGLKVIEVVFL